MFASWVQQGTSTTTAGTITLDGTPADGFQAFSNAFTSGDTVMYTIEDGDNRETGVGTLTSGTDWTLSRDYVYETLSSGTYTRHPANGLTLSGSAIVSIAAGADNVIQPRNRKLWTGFGFDFGEFGPSNGSTNSGSLTSNRVHYVPITFLFSRKASGLTVEVTTADAAGPLTKVGLYRDSVDGQPQSLIESVTVDVTTTGTKTLSFSQNHMLTPGVYYSAIACADGTTVRFRAQLLAGYGLGNENGRSWSLSKFMLYENISSWSDLPSTTGSTTFSTSAPMLIGVVNA